MSSSGQLMFALCFTASEGMNSMLTPKLMCSNSRRTSASSTDRRKSQKRLFTKRQSHWPSRAFWHPTAHAVLH